MGGLCLEVLENVRLIFVTALSLLSGCSMLSLTGVYLQVSDFLIIVFLGRTIFSFYNLRLLPPGLPNTCDQKHHCSFLEQFSSLFVSSLNYYNQEKKEESHRYIEDP